ncbi:MAG: T9SS type A sorting domain-containing protein [Bacteroidetes bacterium]|jgi:hypothetical protein|nr:T9SS type A sorting domain-containing protein [Bacteroidota bacterium]
MKFIYHFRKITVLLLLVIGLNGFSQTFETTFNVDMTEATGFNPSTDIVYLTGTMFSWAMPGTQPENQTMSRVGNSMIWTKTVTVSAGIHEYKYFVNDGWSGGEWQGDPNRIIDVFQNTILNDIWAIYGSQFAVTFNVDMSSADNFDPETDIVYLTGSMFGWSDPGSEPDVQTMNRVGSSMIWTKTLNILEGIIHFKYYINEGWDGAEWLSGPNRQYNITGESILNNVWGVLENMYSITFNVDMSLAIDFNPEEDTVFLTGSMFAWAEPGAQLENQMMSRVESTFIWTKTILLIEGYYEYKYFVNVGWMGGEWMGDPNRVFMVNQDKVIDNYFGLYDNFYSLTFNVDMTSATDFNPQTDVVYITGSMFDWLEPGLFPEEQTLSRVGSSMIWTKSITFIPGGYYQYKYFINAGWDGTEFPDVPINRDLYFFEDMVLNDTWGILTFEAENMAPEMVSLYPNPFTDQIVLGNLEDFDRLLIYDITGRIISDLKLSRSNEIISDLNLQKGLYLFCFMNDKGENKTFKMVRR